MRFLLTLLVITLAACTAADAGKRNKTPPVSEWFFKYGVNEPVMEAGDTFQWGEGQEVAYFLKPWKTPLLPSQTITITYRIEAVSGNPVIKSTECTKGQKDAGLDGALAAVMIRNSTDNTNYFNRAWYIPRGTVTIGTHTITAPLSSPAWTFVAANSGPVQNPDKWARLLKKPRDIALTFNGCSSMGHGAVVEGGAVRFTIFSVTVQ